MKLVPRHKGWTIYAIGNIIFSAVHSNGSAYKRDLTNDSLMGYRHWLRHRRESYVGPTGQREAAVHSARADAAHWAPNQLRRI